jgi:hypothetical protein
VAVDISRRAGDDGDVLMAVRHEVLDNGACAAVVVDVDRIEHLSSNGTVEENHGMRVGQIGHERLRVDIGGHDNDAIDSSAHGAHGAFDLAFVVVRVGDDDVIAGAAGGDVDSADNFGEEFAVEIGQ